MIVMRRRLRRRRLRKKKRLGYFFSFWVGFRIGRGGGWGKKRRRGRRIWSYFFRSKL